MRKRESARVPARGVAVLHGVRAQLARSGQPVPAGAAATRPVPASASVSAASKDIRHNRSTRPGSKATRRSHSIRLTIRSTASRHAVSGVAVRARAPDPGERPRQDRVPARRAGHDHRALAVERHQARRLPGLAPPCPDRSGRQRLLDRGSEQPKRHPGRRPGSSGQCDADRRCGHQDRDSIFRFVAPAAAGPPPRPAPARSAGAGPVGAAGPAAPRATSPRSFVTQWSPVQCPSCQGLKTMRPIVYGRDAQTPGAGSRSHGPGCARRRPAARPNGPNAECRACGTRVRIVNTGT